MVDFLNLLGLKVVYSSHLRGPECELNSRRCQPLVGVSERGAFAVLTPAAHTLTRIDRSGRRVTFAEQSAMLVLV
jgi:hypothetical protein